MKITLMIDNKIINEFYSMEVFVKYYGYQCSTLNISSITYNFDGGNNSYTVNVSTLQHALKLLDLEMEYE